MARSRCARSPPVPASPRSGAARLARSRPLGGAARIRARSGRAVRHARPGTSESSAAWFNPSAGSAARIVADRLERSRRPDGVDVHREPAAGVPGVAVAPAGGAPVRRVALAEAHEVHRPRVSRVGPRLLGHQGELAEQSRRAGVRPSVAWPAGRRASARPERPNPPGSGPRAPAAGTRRRSCGSSRGSAGGRGAPRGPATSSGVGLRSGGRAAARSTRPSASRTPPRSPGSPGRRAPPRGSRRPSGPSFRSTLAITCSTWSAARPAAS